MQHTLGFQPRIPAMSSFLTLLVGFTFFPNVHGIYRWAEPPVDGTTTVFYVFGSEAIYIVDPENKTVQSTIEADGVCTPRRGDSCSFGTEILVRNQLIFVTDFPGSRVHVIDVRKRKVVETVATEPMPYDLYYLPWLEEVWVHAWSNSTFDVIDVSGNLEKTHKAIKAHITPGWTHGFMVANQEIQDGKVGYVTHFRNPGLHQLNLTNKSYKDFHNISDQGCHGTFYLAYSSLNKHTFVECFRAAFILEMYLPNKQVIRKWNFTGKPFASPDGRFIVALYKSINRTTSQLLDSKVHVLRISENGPTSLLPTPNIPSGVSQVVFGKKAGQQSGYVAYISLLYSDKIAVLDLGELESGRAALSYIEGVGFVQTTPYLPGTSRPLFLSGRWLVSPASANSSVAIIDTSTRKLHGMVPGVVEGEGVLAVSLALTSSPPSPTSIPPSLTSSPPSPTSSPPSPTSSPPSTTSSPPSPTSIPPSPTSSPPSPTSSLPSPTSTPPSPTSSPPSATSSPPSSTAGAEGMLRFNGILTLVMLLAPSILPGR